MANMYISPTGAGLRDGSSWENAATIGNLSNLIAKAGPGGEVLIRADMGSYQLNGPLSVTKGGSADHDVTVRGVDGAGNDMKAEFVGTRMDEYIVGGAQGNDGLVLLQGADHLNFKNLAFEDFKVAIRAGWDIADLSISNVSADNVQRFFDNYYNGVTRGATVSGLVIEDVEVHGFSKGAIRLQYDTNNVVIRNVIGDSEHQDKDNFAIGVHLTGTVHNVLIENTTMRNAQDTLGKYWNGDGFATERDVYDIQFKNTLSAGNTDAGYDLKSSSTVLIDTVASDNKRNYRIWSDDVTLINSQSLDPHVRGGTGSQAHIQLNDGAKVTIIDSLIADNDPKTLVFDVTVPNTHVVLDNVDIAMANGGRLNYRPGSGSSVTNIDGTPVKANIWTTDVQAHYRENGFEVTEQPVIAPTALSVMTTQASQGEGLGGSTTMSFIVVRDGDARGETTVSYSINGYGEHAVDATDFTGKVLPSGTVTFAAGETQKVVSLQIQGDSTVEKDETFAVTLGNPVNGTINVGSIVMTVINDDPTPTGLTAIGRAGAIDLSSSANQTVTGAAHHNSFFVDSVGLSGRDAITNFGMDDLLLTTKALYDSNRDGLIGFGSIGRVSVDTPAQSDIIDFSASKVTGLRYLGMTEDSIHVYANAATRPKGFVEGTIGNNTLTADAGDQVKNRFFFDTALDIDLGDDTIDNFGASDMIVTTTRLADVGGNIALDDSSLLRLPGGTGAASDGYFAGEGGTVTISGVSALEYDGSVLRAGTTYHVYTLSGSSIGLADL